jgi:hypothetical protein
MMAITTETPQTALPREQEYGSDMTHFVDGDGRHHHHHHHRAYSEEDQARYLYAK